MIEGAPNELEVLKTEKERVVNEFLALGKELSESGENFPFQGIDPIFYASMKASEDEFPEYNNNPIDSLMARCTDKGVKVMIHEATGTYHVYVLPADSTDTKNDVILPYTLEPAEGMDERLKKLIELHKEADRLGKLLATKK